MDEFSKWLCSLLLRPFPARMRSLYFIVARELLCEAIPDESFELCRVRKSCELLRTDSEISVSFCCVNCFEGE